MNDNTSASWTKRAYGVSKLVEIKEREKSNKLAERHYLQVSLKRMKPDFLFPLCRLIALQCPMPSGASWRRPTTLGPSRRLASSAAAGRWSTLDWPPRLR